MILCNMPVSFQVVMLLEAYTTPILAIMILDFYRLCVLWGLFTLKGTYPHSIVTKHLYNYTIQWMIPYQLQKDTKFGFKK